MGRPRRGGRGRRQGEAPRLLHRLSMPRAYLHLVDAERNVSTRRADRQAERAVDDGVWLNGGTPWAGDDRTSFLAGST